MGKRVDKYIEEADYAGVEVDGQLYKADVVLGADGALLPFESRHTDPAT